MSYDLSPTLIDDPLWSAMAHLPECLRTELEASAGGRLCYTGFMTGTRAGALGYANCSKDKCGAAWVRLVGQYTSSIFPDPDEGVSSMTCRSPMVYEIEMGVARCDALPTGRDMYPDAQDMFNVTRLIMSDSAAMKRALLCCLPKLAGKEILVAVGQWSPLEQGNNLTGGFWQGFVGQR